MDISALNKLLPIEIVYYIESYVIETFDDIKYDKQKVLRLVKYGYNIGIRNNIFTILNYEHIDSLKYLKDGLDLMLRLVWLFVV